MLAPVDIQQLVDQFESNIRTCHKLCEFAATYQQIEQLVNKLYGLIEYEIKIVER